MDLDKFIELYEHIERMDATQKRWVFININHIIDKFNEKYGKHIELFRIE